MSLLFALMVAAPAARAACVEVTEPETLTFDLTSQDETVPSFPDLRSVTIEFLQGEADGCEDCPDLVELVMTFGTTEDDVTPPDEMAYRVTLLTGTLPEGIALPVDPFLGPVATFRWAVDPAIIQDDLLVTLDVRAVDQAGNVSTDSVEVGIEQSGLAIPAVLLGCDHSRAPLALPLLGLAILGRRRRPLKPGTSPATHR